MKVVAHALNLGIKLLDGVDDDGKVLQHKTAWSIGILTPEMIVKTTQVAWSGFHVNLPKLLQVMSQGPTNIHQKCSIRGFYALYQPFLDRVEI